MSRKVLQFYISTFVAYAKNSVFLNHTNGKLLNQMEEFVKYIYYERKKTPTIYFAAQWEMLVTIFVHKHQLEPILIFVDLEQTEPTKPVVLILK